MKHMSKSHPMPKYPDSNFKIVIIPLDKESSDNLPFVGEGYHNGRNFLDKSLEQLMSFLIAPKPEKKETLVQRCSSREVEPVRQAITHVLNSKSVALATLSPMYNRTRLMHWAKVFIGDFLGLMVMDHGVCSSSNHPGKFNAEQGQELVDALMFAHDSLMAYWSDQQLEKDVRELVKQENIKPGINWAPEVKKGLDRKYYWNSFRVHSYTGEFVDPAHMLVGTRNSKRIEVNSNLVLIVHWFSTVIGEDKETGVTQAPLQYPTRQPPKKPPSTVSPSTVKGYLTDAGEPLKLMSGKSEQIKKAIVQMGDASQGTLKPFRNVLKLAGAIGNFLGPAASVVCGILSLSMDAEPGPQEIINVVQKGFHELHQRFDILDMKLGAIKSEIKNAIDVAASYHGRKSDYDSQVARNVENFWKDFNRAIDPNFEGIAAYQNELQNSCYDHQKKKYLPADILDNLESFYFLRNRGETILDGLRDWVKGKEPEKVQRVLLSLALDAKDVGYMVVTGCVNTTRYTSVAYLASLSANAVKVVQKIQKEIFGIYDHYLYYWQSELLANIPGVVSSVDTAATNWEEKKAKIVFDVNNYLKAEYKGNNFLTFVFTKHTTEHHSWIQDYSYRYVYNPDYATFIQSNTGMNEWKLFITWNRLAETEDTLVRSYQCEDLLSNGDGCKIPATIPSGILEQVKASRGHTTRFSLVFFNRKQVQRRYKNRRVPENWRAEWENSVCGIDQSAQPIPYGMSYKDNNVCTGKPFDASRQSMVEKRDVYWEGCLVNGGNGY